VPNCVAAVLCYCTCIDAHQCWIAKFFDQGGPDEIQRFDWQLQQLALDCLRSCCSTNCFTHVTAGVALQGVVVDLLIAIVRGAAHLTVVIETGLQTGAGAAQSRAGAAAALRGVRSSSSSSGSSSSSSSSSSSDGSSSSS
jgi:uncharacterized membrane protein YgcG